MRAFDRNQFSIQRLGVRGPGRAQSYLLRAIGWRTLIAPGAQ